jgi:hypothetical protein
LITALSVAAGAASFCFLSCAAGRASVASGLGKKIKPSKKYF